MPRSATHPWRLALTALSGAALLAAPASAADGTITTLAGSTPGSGGDGGPPQFAQLNRPADADLAPAAIGGGVLIADTINNSIRRVRADGSVIERIAGSGTPSGGFGGDNGAAASAVLAAPQGVTALPDGSYVIADTGNHRIRRVSISGVITTIAGTIRGAGGDGGAATTAQLDSPRDVAVRPDGSLVIADTGNHRIRQIAVDGTISTIAGSGAPGDAGDGGPAVGARLNAPRDVAVLSDGSLVIADTGNHKLRRVAPDGTITTIAGTGTAGNSGDEGAAVEATLNTPSGVTALTNGALLVADSGNNRIRRVTPLGTIFSVAGSTAGLSGDGGPASRSRLSSPQDVVRTPTGGMVIADTANSRIRSATDVGALPDPITDRLLGLQPTTGTATVRPRPASSAIVVREPDVVVDGSELNTERGGLAVSVRQAGDIRTTTLTQGRVLINQDAGRNPLTAVRLIEPLTACPTRAKETGRLTPRAARLRIEPLAKKPRKGRRERRVVARGDARFRTDGRYGSATVRGTQWQMTDTCRATSVRVFTGVVSVFDRPRGKRVTVTAGQRYVVRAKR